jgi:hypothetical protein
MGETVLLTRWPVIGIDRTTRPGRHMVDSRTQRLHQALARETVAIAAVRASSMPVFVIEASGNEFVPLTFLIEICCVAQ